MTVNFPNEIDDRLFISDTSVSTEYVYLEHLRLLKQNQLSAAADLLNNEPVVAMNAKFFNYLDSVIRTIQTYMLNEMDKTIRCVSSENEPEYKGIWTD